MEQEKVEITDEHLLDVMESGYTPAEAAEILDLSTAALQYRINKLRKEQSVIAAYRPLKNLHLTKLQVRILESISDEDIQMASLGEKVKAFKILQDAEHIDVGKPTEITGSLAAHLIKLQEEKTAAMQPAEVIVNINANEEDFSEL